MRKTWKYHLLTLTLAFILVLCTRCAERKPEGNGAGGVPPNGDDHTALEYFLDEIYACGGYSKMLTDMLNAPPSTEDVFYNHLVTTRITEENEKYFLGSTELVYDAAIASDPAMSPTLYSLCLLSASDSEQAEKLAKELKKSADPRKWVCMGLPDENVYVAQSGCYVMLVMSAEDGERLTDAFYEVMGRTAAHAS